MCECRPIQTYRGRELKTLLRVSIGIYYIDIKIVNHITFIEIRSVVSEISAFKHITYTHNQTAIELYYNFKLLLYIWMI